MSCKELYGWVLGCCWWCLRMAYVAMAARRQDVFLATEVAAGMWERHLERDKRSERAQPYGSAVRRVSNEVPGVSIPFPSGLDCHSSELVTR